MGYEPLISASFLHCSEIKVLSYPKIKMKLKVASWSVSSVHCSEGNANFACAPEPASCFLQSCKQKRSVGWHNCKIPLWHWKGGSQSAPSTSEARLELDLAWAV